MNEQFILDESGERIFVILPYNEYLELTATLLPANEPNNLQEKIAKEVNEGRLARYWTTSDLLNNTNLSDEYKDATLKTHPANYSISIQDVNLGNGHNVNINNPIYLRTGKRNGAIVYTLA